jgi:hypothetical protein
MNKKILIAKLKAQITLRKAKEKRNGNSTPQSPQAGAPKKNDPQG